MALGLGCIVSCSISVSAIFRSALRLSSSRKLATMCYNRNRHCRAQPSGWLYDSTTQRHELSRTLISVGQLDASGICAGFSSGGWTLHKGNLLLAQGPKVHSLYPLYVIRREGDLFPHVIALAWTTETPQQGRHHAPIQSRLHPQILLLGSPILRALLVRQTGSRIMLSRGQKYKLVKLVKRR